MPDIIDNRERKLADTIRDYMRVSRAAHFAVGYFYLGGFEAIAADVPGLEKLRLLIGPSMNRPTIEQIVRGYKVRPLVQQQWTQETSRRALDRRQMGKETALDARETLALMEQTDKNARALADLAQLIADGVIEVRIYTREPLHAKCYIFDERDLARAEHNPGWVIVGSSNLTAAGITSNTELNVVMHEPDAHRQVSAWFERLWDQAEDFSADLLQEVQQSWAVNDQVTPWEIYIKTLYNLFRDQLEAEEETEAVEVIDDRWPELATFQDHAYRFARTILDKYGGVLIADVVGLGKSYIGIALLKRGRLQGMRPLIICPAGLVGMWEVFSEVYDLGAPVVSMGLLTTKEQDDGSITSYLDGERYEDRDLVLIDESHNLRHRNTQRYQAVQAWLERGDRKVIMLTATPMATSPSDIHSQLRLWPGNGQDLPTGPWDLDEFFGKVRQGEADLPELLRHIMIRRPRWFVAETYGEWRRPDGTRCQTTNRDERWEECRPVIPIGEREYTFPRRELHDPVSYRIDETYAGVYEIIRAIIDPQYRGPEPLDPEAALDRIGAGRARVGKEPPDRSERRELAAAIAQRLSYARYGLHEYVKTPYRKRDPYQQLAAAGKNLRGLMRILLFKRLESSVEAFRRTTQRVAEVHRHFEVAIREGRVPAGEEMQRALYDLGVEEVAAADVVDAIEWAEGKSGVRYDINAFRADELLRDLERDRVLLGALYDMVCDLGPEQDAKLQELTRLLDYEIPSDRKVLIFTQFAETAEYLYEQLKHRPGVEWVSGSHKNVAEIVARFAPLSNPAIAGRYRSRRAIRVLVATDVLSEGLNLQDAHYVVNYDLHFNPVRLIQRMGRIDRLTPYFPEDAERCPEVVWAYNFFPETALDAHLGLEEKVRRRVQDMREIVGLDAPVLHPSEQVDEHGVIAIYTGDRSVMEGRDEDDDLRSGLLEAEQLIRRLMKETPELLDRIRNLRDGVRSARAIAEGRRYFVYCQAGSYHQFYLADETGRVVSSDLREAIEAIACNEEEPRGKLPKDTNRVVNSVRCHFEHIVRELESSKQKLPRLSQGQNYVIRHLRALRGAMHRDNECEQLDLLIEAYRRPVSQAVRRRLNFLRKNKVEGNALVRELTRIYRDYDLHRSYEVERHEVGVVNLPRIICSEAL
ncbi:MAG: helicase-related protein [Armatimonadota bacterium]